MFALFVGGGKKVGAHGMEFGNSFKKWKLSSPF